MDFTFDDLQTQIRDLARQILDERATPARIREVEEGSEGIDRDLWGELARTDLLGVALPEDVGGSGHGIAELCVLLEEVGRRVAPVPMLSTIGLGALPIAVFGNDEQRKRYLVPVIEGTSLLTAAMQEGPGGDPLLPQTRAMREGSAWRLRGAKTAVPHAPLCSWMVVTATGEDGPMLLVVDTQAAGMRIEATRSTHREPIANVVFEDVSVGEENVLVGGEEAIRHLYRHALACLCAIGVGVFEEAVRITAAYISERQQFDRPIATFQGATIKAADAFIDAAAVRATTWSAIWRLSEGRSCDDELAIAKYWVADGGQRIVHACQHLHGGIGVDTDYPVHRYFLWAKHLELTLGGATPQLLKIGASIAGED